MEDLHAHIIASAKWIAHTQGLDSVNLRAVAKQSGLAVGTIYNYFPDKQTLVLHVLTRIWQQAFSDLDMGALCRSDLFTAMKELYEHILSNDDLAGIPWSLSNHSEETPDPTAMLLARIDALLLAHQDAFTVPLHEAQRTHMSVFLHDQLLCMLHRRDSFTFMDGLLRRIAHGNSPL